MYLRENMTYFQMKMVHIIVTYRAVLSGAIYLDRHSGYECVRGCTCVCVCVQHVNGLSEAFCRLEKHFYLSFHNIK